MADIESLKEGGIVSIRDELLRQQAEGKKVARTESGDPSFNVPEVVTKAITKALVEDKTHYTAGAGIAELREAIALKLSIENGFKGYSSKNVLVTNGAMNALYVVFQAMANSIYGKTASLEQAEVLVPTPTWTETVDNVKLADLEPVYYTLDPFKNVSIDLEEIESKITEKTVAVVINTPHNPTGDVLSKKTLSDLVDLCKKHDIYLVSDEAYEHIIGELNSHISPGRLDYGKIISIFSFSKSYAMSGLRLGYVACQDMDLIKKMAKMIRCTINGVNSITQWGGIAALKETPESYFKEMSEAYELRKWILYNAVMKCSFLEPVLPKGAFYIWAKIGENDYGIDPDGDGWDATAFLLENGVGSAPGCVFGPGGKGHVRLAFSCADEYIYMASEILKKL